MKQRTMTNLLRSSAAEYLTYAAVHGEDKESVEVRYENENLWLTQKMMSMLYGVSVAAINQHIKKVLADHELERAAVIKQYLITANTYVGAKILSKNHRYLRDFAGL